jgi:hypothetical protein
MKRKMSGLQGLVYRQDGARVHKTGAYRRAVLPILGGMLIGILAALILRLVSGRLAF